MCTEKAQRILILGGVAQGGRGGRESHPSSSVDQPELMGQTEDGFTPSDLSGFGVADRRRCFEREGRELAQRPMWS
jgi:hypothetical protein